jgi:hypothetical protein
MKEVVMDSEALWRVFWGGPRILHGQDSQVSTSHLMLKFVADSGQTMGFSRVGVRMGNKSMKMALILS